MIGGATLPSFGLKPGRKGGNRREAKRGREGEEDDGYPGGGRWRVMEAPK